MTSAKQSSLWPRLLRSVLIIGLAVMWLFSGFNKLVDLQAFTESISRFRFMDQAAARRWIPLVAVYLPWFELVLAGGVLVRASRPAAALISLLLLLVFTAALFSAWIRGLDIECGCFGDRFQLSHVKWGVARNFALMAWVVVLLLVDRRADHSGGSLDEQS